LPTWIDAIARDDLADGGVAALALDGRPVALFRLDGEFFALHDVCPHGMAHLSDGFIEGGCVECPLHQGLVDIRTGEPRLEPITEAVKTYPVRLVGDRVEVEV
jgi:anthranilate 1,2-dioxygenase ferredoxin component